MNNNILIVDDDRRIVEAISTLLKLSDYNTYEAYDGFGAIDTLKKENIDLIILDVMMPNMDGLMALKTIRKYKNIPILMLSAKVESSDKVLGLQYGADDYISKPYDPQELLARVASNLRRYTYLGSKQVREENKSNVNELISGGLEINLDTRVVVVDGDEVKLTPKEYDILKLLLSNAGAVFTVAQIYENVWDGEAVDIYNMVMVHIRRLRQKIEINTKNAKYVKVVWGVGYKVEKY